MTQILCPSENEKRGKYRPETIFLSPIKIKWSLPKPQVKLGFIGEYIIFQVSQYLKHKLWVPVKIASNRFLRKKKKKKKYHNFSSENQQLLTVIYCIRRVNVFVPVCLSDLVTSLYNFLFVTVRNTHLSPVLQIFKLTA